MAKRSRSQQGTAAAFAKELWAEAKLGDARRTKRAVAALALATEHPLGSFVEACRGDDAEQERLYRFIRDPRTDRAELVNAGCTAMCRMAARECAGDIVVVQDTTSAGYAHAVKKELGDLGSGRATARRRGFFAHVSLAMDEERGTVVGPVDIQFAIRPPREDSSKRDNKKIPYEEKESIKWEAAASAVDERCAEFRERLIFVSDRESDVYEYLMAMVGSDLRFVVRSSWNRRLADTKIGLRARVAEQPELCRVRVHIEQKAGRPARDAILAVRAVPIGLDGRKHSQEVLPPLAFNAVQLKEVDTTDGISPIDWLLLTTEPIATTDHVLRVARLYCLRWVIEEYNKCCKSDGTNIEALRMQTRDALLRAVVLCMFAAVPLMRLRCDLLGDDIRRRWPQPIKRPKAPTPPEPPPSKPCTSVLPQTYWPVLWQAVERETAIPEQVPTCRWALSALAKLGGWMDSKRTGRPGYTVLWKGWDRLLERVDAVRLATMHK